MSRPRYEERRAWFAAVVGDIDRPDDLRVLDSARGHALGVLRFSELGPAVLNDEA